jgi:hypothetical protein
MRKYTVPILIGIFILSIGGYGVYKYFNKEKKNEQFKNDIKEIEMYEQEASELLEAKLYHQGKDRITAAIKILEKYKNNKQINIHNVAELTCGERQAYLRFGRAFIECKLHKDYKTDKQNRENALDDLEWIDKNGYIKFLFKIGLKFWKNKDILLTLQKEPRFLKLFKKYMKIILKDFNIKR